MLKDNDSKLTEHVHNGPMDFYTILEAATTLINQQQWMLRRCRRASDGNLRYVVFDQFNRSVIARASLRKSRLGFTLQEILSWLSQQECLEMARLANALLMSFNAAIASELQPL